MSFAANIVALIQSPSNTIKTFSDFLGSPLLLGIDQDTFDGQRIHEEFHMDYVNVSNGDNGVARLQTEYFALLGIASSIYKGIANTFKESEKCGLSEIHILHYPMNTIIVEKQSAIKELMKQRYLITRNHVFSMCERKQNGTLSSFEYMLN